MQTERSIFPFGQDKLLPKQNQAFTAENQQRMYYPNPTKTGYQLIKFFEVFNAGLPKREQLKSGHEKLIIALTKLAKESFKNGIWVDDLEMQEIPIYTNNFDLSNLCRRCDHKSIYNWINRLESNKLIRKEFRGRQHDYKLWIPAWLVLGMPCPISFFNRGKPSHFSSKATLEENFPPINTRTRINNIVISSVEEKDSNKDTKNGILASHSVQVQELQEQHKNKARTQEANGAAKKSQEQNSRARALCAGVRIENKLAEGQPKETGSKQPRYYKKKQGVLRGETSDSLQLATGQTFTDLGVAPINYLDLVILLWEHAKNTFYSHYQFTPKEERKIKNIIYFNVFGAFKESRTEQQWKSYFRQCIERIDLAKDYVNKSSDRFIPHPKKYFDKDFASGFHRTFVWWLKRQTIRNQVKNQLELQKARKSMQTGMLPKGSRPPHYLTLTRLQLYHYWENRLKKNKDEDILQAFYQSCTKLTIITPNQLNNN